MCKPHKKRLIVLTCIGGLAFSPVPYAAVSAVAKLAKSSSAPMKTVKAVGQMRTVKSVSPAFKPVKAASFKPAPPKMPPRPKAIPPARPKPLLVPKNAGQFRMNRQRLAIQTGVKRSVDLAKKNLRIKAPATLRGKFKSHANPGIIYRRQLGKKLYIGQTKNLKRYPKRQAEHSRKLKKQMGTKYRKPSFQIVGGAPGNNARLLRVAEEAAYRAQQRFVGKLTNKVRPMTNRKYVSAIRR